MATVMEAFDAQMMDYHYDGDIQMQPSHEVWFQDEALMEDDGQQLHGETQSNNTEYQAVEIEMEENYSEIGQNPEYEMADEATDYPVSGVDEEDIIVADDSHSPEVNVGTVVSFQASSEVLTSASTFPSPHGPHSQLQEAAGPSLDSSQIGGGASDFAEISSAVQTPHTNSATAETHVAPVTEATQSVVDAHNDRTIAGADEERVPVESIDRVGLPIEAGESHESPNKEAPAAESAQPQVNDETYDSGTHSLGEEHGAQDGLLHEARSQGYVGEESTEDHHALLHKSSVSTTITTTSHASAAAAESSQPSEQQEAEVQHDPLVSDSTLEPPPGILLSFPATEQEDACLFTQPNYPESSTAVAHPYRVLFEQSPALYYEPLSTVFEVLRQDQTLASAGDFSHSELVLDAYDLQLTVSEDNIFARETSLYDLHQLHVGSDFSGPLRLRLHTTSPRFIVRYRLLQEQIYRLDLTAQEYEDGGKEPEQYEGQGTAEEPPVEQILQAEGTAEEAHAQELTTTENDVEELGHDYDEEGEGEGQEQEQEEHDDDDDDSDTLTSNETTEDTHDHHIGQEVREQEERNEEPAVSQDNVSEQDTSEQGADLAEAQTVDLPTNEETETGGNEDETADHQDGSDSGSNHEEGSEAREPTTEKETTPTEEPDPSRNPEEEGTAEEVDDPSSVDEDDLQNVSENGDEDSFGQSDYADDWDDTFEDDGALDTTFEEPEGQEIVAGDSNNTLSSKSSKRSIDEVDGGEGTSEQAPSQLDSPGSKRLRTI